MRVIPRHATGGGRTFSAVHAAGNATDNGEPAPLWAGPAKEDR
jgi:hypothetical protein